MDDNRQATDTEPSEAAASSATALDDVQRQRDEYYDLLLRKSAEFDNFRKRIERERQSVSDAAAADLIQELLPLVDNLERALATPASGPAAEAYRQGVELIHRQLLEILRKRGVTPIEALGADCYLVDDGRTAVEAAGQQSFDLILMDMRMPRLGGVEAARAIRAGGGPNDGVPILAFTAQRNGGALDPMFAGVIDKPIQLASLQTAIVQALEGPPTREASHAA